MQKRRWDKDSICTYGALMIGVLVGCFFLLEMMALGKDGVLDYGLEDYDISVMFNAPSNEIMIHLIKKRCMQVILFLLLFVLTTYYCASFLFCGYFGIFYGFVVCNLIIKYGISGLLYGFICFFPHYMLYFWMIFWGGKWTNKKQSSLNKCYRDVNGLEYFIKIFVIIGLFTLSLSWEINFQKNFLNYFFQYLV